MKGTVMMKFFWAISLLVAMITFSASAPAEVKVSGAELLGDGSVRIHGVVLGPVSSQAPDREPLALLADAAGAETIIVRSISRTTGLRVGDDLVITFPENRLAVK